MNEPEPEPELDADSSGLVQGDQELESDESDAISEPPLDRRPREGGFDLHMHTDFSDGELCPHELLRRAVGRIKLLSICDHDTIRAYENLPDPCPVPVLPGVEISTTFHGKSVHMLAYFPDGFPHVFRDAVAGFEQARRLRTQRGIESLRESGVPLRWASLEAHWGRGVPCRSHVARAMIEAGFARSMRAVFSKYLATADFAAPDLQATEAADFIRASGGFAVWAHPYPPMVLEHGAELAKSGLHGVEVYLPRRNLRQRKKMLRFANWHGLFATGGSDFHGNFVHGGRQSVGGFSVPMELLPKELNLANQF